MAKGIKVDFWKRKEYQKFLAEKNKPSCEKQIDDFLFVIYMQIVSISILFIADCPDHLIFLYAIITGTIVNPIISGR